MNYNIDTGAIESMISLPICQRVVNCDVSEDVTVPDGFPEVRRVLALKENILSPAKFVGARSVDFSGAVDYTLIYVGADGKLCSAPFSAEYSFSLPIENADKIDINEGVSVLCALSGENMSVRISTPKRLQIRSGIRASVICFGRAVCSEDLRGIEDPSTLERLQLEGECAKVVCEGSDIVTLSDEYILSEGSRIIYSDALSSISDSRIDGEVVRVSGEVTVRLIVENGDRIEKVIRKIPFEAETDLEELDIGEENIFCRASGTVNELDVTVEDNRALIEAGLVIEVCVAQNKNITYTRDIYSTKQSSVCEYKTSALPIALINKNANLTQSERVTASDVGFPDGADIVDVWGTAICEEGKLENGRYVLRGKTKYKFICKRDGEFSSCEAEVPFKYEADSGDCEIENLCVKVSVMGARARKEGEDLFVEGELALSLAVFGAARIDMLSCASFGEEYRDEKNQFVVCFRSDAESTFDLAKRYHVSCDAISTENESCNFVILER